MLKMTFLRIRRRGIAKRKAELQIGCSLMMLAEELRCRYRWKEAIAIRAKATRLLEKLLFVKGWNLRCAIERQFFAVDPRHVVKIF